MRSNVQIAEWINSLSENLLVIHKDKVNIPRAMHNPFMKCAMKMLFGKHAYLQFSSLTQLNEYKMHNSRDSNTLSKVLQS